MSTTSSSASRLLSSPRIAPRTSLAQALPVVRSLSSSKTEYYYDSQSGKHVPVHDETHVDILVAANRGKNEEDDIFVSADQLLAWASQGVSGVKLDCPQQSSSSGDVTSLLQGLSVPEHFQLWLPHGVMAEPTDINQHVVQWVEYDSENKEQMQSVVADLASAKLWSAIICRDAESLDAMLTASGVASTLDETKGGNYVYLVGQESDAIIELAEELGYLDVEGPTLKARMVIDLTEIQDDPDEALSECMIAGINKFVVKPDRLQWVSDLVQEQGKTCDVRLES